MWSPDQYRRFHDARGRAFFDLLARVHAPEARMIADLGCGPGELTRTLAERWTEARVVGVDSSPEMIAAAAEFAVEGRLRFELGDLTTWQAPEALDVVVANASLQWVDDHAGVLARIAAMLQRGGVMAVQMPGNFGAPSHTILASLRSSPRWAAKLGALSSQGVPVAEPDVYLRLLTQLGLHADVWETTYYHVLAGEDPVLEWTKGTALRPVLMALATNEDRAAFCAEYAALLREAYPREAFGTVLPFRRIFFVGTAPG
jgi:trans-aconitate 2-methyltransferase